MNDAVRKHMVRYPNCRTSTVQYLAKREETTHQLMKEVLEEQRRRTPLPWWKRVLGMGK